MRIVSGIFGGRVIDAPADRTTRPTTDRVRESVFSAVYSRAGDLTGVHVLDAFAGSGALGLEALSRGAAMCTFFERDAQSFAVLKGNIASLGLGTSQARAVRSDVLARQGARLAAGGPYGLVLLDPPYALDVAEVLSLLDGLAGESLLEPGCTIVYEHAADNSAAAERLFREDASFEVTGLKKYGKIGVLYLAWNN